jgi:cyclophilin family peptidyl-prolyl cis-trans isomerase
MARSSSPDSANSQFFIVFEAAPHLDGQYTIFGKVVDGMELVDQIKKGDGANGEVSSPDTIVKMELASEAG